MLDFQMQVLMTGFWPMYKRSELALAPEMSEWFDLFRDWHTSKHRYSFLETSLFVPFLAKRLMISCFECLQRPINLHIHGLDWSVQPRRVDHKARHYHVPCEKYSNFSLQCSNQKLLKTVTHSKVVCTYTPGFPEWQLCQQHTACLCVDNKRWFTPAVLYSQEDQILVNLSTKMGYDEPAPCHMILDRAHAALFNRAFGGKRNCDTLSLCWPKISMGVGCGKTSSPSITSTPLL